MNKHPLRAYREANGLKQVDLAKSLDTTKQTICRIEAGVRTPSAELMLRIADVTAGAVMPNDLLLPVKSSEAA